MQICEQLRFFVRQLQHEAESAPSSWSTVEALIEKNTFILVFLWDFLMLPHRNLSFSLGTAASSGWCGWKCQRGEFTPFEPPTATRQWTTRSPSLWSVSGAMDFCKRCFVPLSNIIITFSVRIGFIDLSARGERASCSPAPFNLTEVQCDWMKRG